MKFEAMNQPTETKIFPIPSSLVGAYFEQFSDFDESQITLITNVNAAVVNVEDPAHHLLALAERPDLSDPQSQQARAYRAGVCIGLAILRKRNIQLSSAGTSIPDLKIKPMTSYFGDGVDPLAWEYFSQSLLDIRVVLEATKVTEPLAYGLYTADDLQPDLADSFALSGLKAKWHTQMSFMEVEGTKLGEADNIGLGISHTFRLYSELEDSVLEGIGT